MVGLPVSLGLVVVSVLVIWKGSEYFERSAERLSKHYGLPVAVHGAIVVAVGSSFPELSSVVISTVLHGDFSLGVGAIVGSAIFNLLVIPALSALFSEELEATRSLVHKDAQFYIISVLVLFIVFALGATYVHIMCERHEVVLSNGAWTESFQPGDYSLQGIGEAQRSEILELFPELATEGTVGSGFEAARRVLKKHEARLIAL